MFPKVGAGLTLSVIFVDFVVKYFFFCLSLFSMAAEKILVQLIPEQILFYKITTVQANYVLFKSNNPFLLYIFLFCEETIAVLLFTYIVVLLGICLNETKTNNLREEFRCF